MQAAWLGSKQKVSALSGAASESLGKLSETVVNKSQLIKEDIMEEYERVRVSTLPDRSNGMLTFLSLRLNLRNIRSAN
jgi:hypothetical protein